MHDEENYFILTEVNKLSRYGNRVCLDLKEGEIILEFLDNDLFRLITRTDTETDLKSSAAVPEHQMSFEDFEIEENKEFYLIKTGKLVIEIKKRVFALSIYDINGELINQDFSEKALGWFGQEVRAWKEKRQGERFYGLGEKTGFLDKNGKKYVLWNTDAFETHTESTDSLYLSIPFFIGLKEGKGYGIYFDNTFKSHFDFSDNSIYSFGSEGGVLDYYFIYGPEIKKIIADYSKLTGRMPLPPLWSLGYQQSRYSYCSEEEVRELAAEFREKEIPCDVIYLDIHYMDGYRVFTWDEHKFPEPEKMLDELSNKGFKVVAIIDPGIKKDPEYFVYRDGVKKGMFCNYLEGDLFSGKVWPGECVFPDFTRKEVREWWGNLNRELLKTGIRGIWNDMNEPAVFNETGTMDLEIIHENDGEPGTHRRFHNLYALFENMATYNEIKQSTGKRPFILTRAGFTGIQRYAALWTGDNRSIWEHLKMSIPMLLNLGLSGIGFAGSDVGGFIGDTGAELLTRWIQLGVFMPFFRNHCGLDCLHQEPWSFGQPYEDIIRDFIRLRYRLLPYLYTLFYQCSNMGIPIMRPLLMEFPDDEETYNLSDQLMLGENILVAPVLEPDKRKRLVYLPEGKWYDYWTGKEERGRNHIISEAPLDRIPIYIRAGSIIPLTEPVNYIGEKKSRTLELNIYLSNEINEYKGMLYEDDGEGFDYQNGIYNLMFFSLTRRERNLLLNVEWKNKNYSSSFTEYILRIFNLVSKPEGILQDDIPVKKWRYFKDKQELRVTFSPEFKELIIL
jgi:alpha-glucosidase